MAEQCDGDSSEPTSALDEETMKQVEKGMLDLLPNGSNVRILTSSTLDPNDTLLLNLALSITAGSDVKGLYLDHA
jgi:hypothetical protein